MVAGPLDAEENLQPALCWGDQSGHNSIQVWQHGLPHDGGAPPLVTHQILDRLPHIFSTGGVEVSLQSVLLSLLCLFYTSFQPCPGGVIYICLNRLKGNFIRTELNLQSILPVFISDTFTLNICQSLHSCRAAVALSVLTWTVFADGLTLFTIWD